MKYQELEKLIEVVHQLRHPENGCPWDLEQTHHSLLKYLLEETYEYLHVAEQLDYLKMNEELGDILLQVLLHSTIAEQENHFTLESVAKTLREKLINRHPHVFSPIPSDGKDSSSPAKKITTEEVKKNWVILKEQEKSAKNNFPKNNHKSSFDPSFLAFPSLLSALKIGEKSQQISFDWENYAQVIYKVEEEWQELKEELPPTGQFNKERVSEELGDLLFSVAQLARHLDLNPEECLRKANKKFIGRFQGLESILIKDQLDLKNLTDQEKELLWSRAKRGEK